MFFNVKLRLSLFINSNNSFFVPQPQFVDRFLTTSIDDPGLTRHHYGLYLKDPIGSRKQLVTSNTHLPPRNDSRWFFSCCCTWACHTGHFRWLHIISHVPSTGTHRLIFLRAWTKMSDSFLPWSKLACVQTHMSYAGPPYCLVTYRRNVLKVTTRWNEWLLKLSTVPSQSV